MPIIKWQTFYLKFVSSFLQMFDQAYCLDHVPIKAWIAIIILPILVFSWIRNLDNLAPLSILANFSIFIGLIFIFYDEFYHLTTSDEKYKAPFRAGEVIKPFGTLLGTSLFFGNVVYSFEGIGVVSLSSLFPPLSLSVFLYFGVLAGLF